MPAPETQIGNEHGCGVAWPVEAPPVDRRWASRKAASTRALIVSPELSTPVSCVVRDISTTGARLELVVGNDNLLGGRLRLPPIFTLKMTADRMEVDCAICWRCSGDIGVRFKSTPRSLSRARA